VCIALVGAGLLVGREALHAARLWPKRFEPHLKRRVDDGSVLLGDTEYPVPNLWVPILSQVRDLGIFGSLPGADV
jgi:hypothetical protein